MKKKNIINLIKYHYTEDEFHFRTEANEVARDFDKNGDHQLAEYVMSFVSSINTFSPQAVEKIDSRFLRQISTNSEALPLPAPIIDDIKGVINAVNHNMGINKFLFEGDPGTGKTESAKQVARLLSRDLYIVNFNELIDSKMGQTAKNMSILFNEINRLPFPKNIIVLFDEIDAIALDRINGNDIREMGRVTSSFLKELDALNKDVVLIATTNLFKKFDRALIRRFDSVISFDRYTQRDLLEIAESILMENLKKFKTASSDMQLFKKIMLNMEKIPNPGELGNLIRVSMAFSDPSDKYDYLRRLLKSSQNRDDFSLSELKEMSFTVRESEILTGVSKSQIARELRNKDNE